MSTLEKTIGLLETMPNDKIETVYAFVRFIDSPIRTRICKKRDYTVHARNCSRICKSGIDRTGGGGF